MVPGCTGSCWQRGTIWSVTAAPFGGGSGRAPPGLLRLARFGSALERLHERRLPWNLPSLCFCSLPDNLALGSDSNQRDAGAGQIWGPSVSQNHHGTTRCPEQHSHPRGCLCIRKSLQCCLVYCWQGICKSITAFSSAVTSLRSCPGLSDAASLESHRAGQKVKLQSLYQEAGVSYSVGPSVFIFHQKKIWHLS